MSRAGSPSRIRQLTTAAPSVVAALAAVTAFASAAGATTYTISSLGDGVAVDGACTLREAIRAASTDALVNECPAGGVADEIALLTAGTYVFDDGDEAVGAGRLSIAGVGSGPDDTVIDMDSQNRFLRLLFGADVSIERLTLLRGSSLSTLPAIGGSIWGQSGSSLTLRDAVVLHSTATYGGAIGGLSMTLRVERAEFVENEALGIAEAPNAQGGAIGISNFGGDVLLADVLFRRNRVSTTFGSGVAQGGAATITVSAPGPARARAVLRRVTVENHEVAAANPYSPGLAIGASSSADVVVEDSRFEGSRYFGSPGSADGAGMLASASGDGTVTIRRVELVENTGTGDCAQLLVRASGDGAAIVDGVLARDGAVTGIRLSNAGDGRVLAGQLTVSGNAPEGLRAERTGAGELRLENSILWNNGGTGQPDADFFAVGAVDADRLANHNWIGSEGDPDPLFVDPGGGDFTLQVQSPAVDTGDATFESVGPYDLRHAPRVAGGAIDLGAFERGGVFGDGFESADLSAWSTAAP